jgi:uncharacterized membrane protein YraQ (UPF0718 family)
MTLVRVGSAALLAAFVGYVVSKGTDSFKNRTDLFSPSEHACTHDHEENKSVLFLSRWRRVARAGFVELVDGTAPWIVLGLVVAAVAEPMLMQMLWAQWSDVLEVAAFAILGMPIFVCAAGATPLVAVLIAAGVSPGAAIAFLLTGPATNVSTFGVLRKLHGSRTAWMFAGVTAAGAIAIGLAVNALPIAVARDVAVEPEPASLLEWASLAGLLVLYAGSVLRRGGRAFLAELFDTGAPAPAH